MEADDPQRLSLKGPSKKKKRCACSDSETMFHEWHLSK